MLTTRQLNAETEVKGEISKTPERFNSSKIWPGAMVTRESGWACIVADLGEWFLSGQTSSHVHHSGMCMALGLFREIDMFQAKLACDGCEFVSKSFVLGYYPPSDRVDFVFQNLIDNTIRIVSCGEISRKSRNESPTEQQLDAVVDRLSVELRQENEVQLEVWASPDSFGKRKCPSCNQQLVMLKLQAFL